MAQSDIAEILEQKYPEWVSYYDIMGILEINRASVLRSLRCLSKRDEIEVKTIYIEKYIGRRMTYYRIKKNG